MSRLTLLAYHTSLDVEGDAAVPAGPLGPMEIRSFAVYIAAKVDSFGSQRTTQDVEHFKYEVHGTCMEHVEEHDRTGSFRLACYQPRHETSLCRGVATDTQVSDERRQLQTRNVRLEARHTPASSRPISIHRNPFQLQA